MKTFRYEVSTVYTKPLDCYGNIVIATSPEHAEALVRQMPDFKKHGGKIGGITNLDVLQFGRIPLSPLSSPYGHNHA